MNSDSDYQINFPICPICSKQEWELVYKGPVRDGSFGSYRDSEIRRCKKCGID